jgi:hypothetical protein
VRDGLSTARPQPVGPIGLVNTYVELLHWWRELTHPINTKEDIVGRMTRCMKCPSGWMTGQIQGMLHSYYPSDFRGSFILPLIYVILSSIRHTLLLDEDKVSVCIQLDRRFRQISISFLQILQFP